MATSCDQPDSKGQHSTGGGILGLLLRGVVLTVATVAVAVKAVTRDGTLAAMGREAIKDIRNTIHQVFFGRGEGHHEPGAPLNPTQGEIAADRKSTVYGPAMPEGFRSPEAIAASRGSVHGPSQENTPLRSPEEIAAASREQRGGDGTVLTQRKPDGVGWAEWVRDQQRQKGGDGNADNDQAQRERGRSLPDEERQRQENERGGRDR